MNNVVTQAIKRVDLVGRPWMLFSTMEFRGKVYDRLWGLYYRKPTARRIAQCTAELPKAKPDALMGGPGER